MRSRGKRFLLCFSLEYSKGKQSKENGGFVGLFQNQCLKSNRLFDAEEGKVIEPIQTRLLIH